MKKTIFTIATLFSIIVGLVIFNRTKKVTAPSLYSIGILQTASHPALDAAREGFIEELKATLGDRITFITQNAQGSIMQAHAFAQQFHVNNRLSGFFAIATPAAQALAAIEKKKAIVIAAVTDPNALGLIHPTTNVTGVKDMVDVKATVNMLMELLPNARTVSIVYTAGETNSIVLVNQMRQELAAHGLTPLDFAVNNEADIPTIVDVACRKSDLILAPTDNTVASTITLISSIAHKHKKPVIVSDNMLVKYGPLAARGIDYKESGKEAARIAYAIVVEGKKPHEIPIQQTPSEKIFINKTSLDRLGLTVPKILKHSAIFITQD